MPRKLRIDSVTASAGMVSIGYTASNGVLPGTASRQALQFVSKAELIAAMKSFENGLTDEQLMLLLIATGYKTDNALNVATLNGLIGKTVALTLQTGVQLVTVA